MKWIILLRWEWIHLGYYKNSCSHLEFVKRNLIKIKIGKKDFNNINLIIPL